MSFQTHSNGKNIQQLLGFFFYHCQSSTLDDWQANFEFFFLLFKILNKMKTCHEDILQNNHFGLANVSLFYLCARSLQYLCQKKMARVTGNVVVRYAVCAEIKSAWLFMA